MSLGNNDFEREYTVQVLPHGSSAFVARAIALDALRHIAASVKDKLGASRGLLVHAAQIIPDEAVKN